MELPDAIRQLEKAVDVLEGVDAMMRAEAQMNAAKHMNVNVRPNPLASAVSTCLDDIKRSLEGEKEIYGEDDLYHPGDGDDDPRSLPEEVRQ